MKNSISNPAFGQLVVTKSTGSPKVLYGSRVSNHSAIHIQLFESSCSSEYGQSYFLPGKLISDIELSPAQWSSFVSSFGDASGTPCTIKYANDAAVPSLKEADYTSTYQDSIDYVKELEEEDKDTMVAITSEILDTIKTLSQVKQERIKSILGRLVSNATSHQSFTVKNAMEEIEKGIVSAAQEVESMINSKIEAKGIDSFLSDAHQATKLLDKEDN